MLRKKTFRKLMEPDHIGSVQTKNRILKTGSTPGFFPWEDGHIQQKIIDHYEALAKGGAGLVTVGPAPLGVPPGMGYLMDDDRFLPGMKRLAESIQKYDCPAFLQMFHIGPMLPPFLESSGVRSVAASSLDKNELPLPGLAIPKELSISEIEGIVQEFGTRAERARKAGFQGIELNAANNHLLNSFLSRVWNKRQDAYGFSTLEGRAKIVVDIIQEIKRRSGKDFAIIALINGAEPGLEKGITSEESQGISKILEAAGADAIHVRAKFYSRPKDPRFRDCTAFPDIAFYPEIPYPVEGIIDTRYHGAGGWVPLAAAIKKVVSIPVIAVGRLDPELGEKLLRRGIVDFIGLNRRLMADPELPNKIAEGRLEDILPCTGCLTCFDNNEHGLPPLCRVNAALGKEKEYEIKPAEKKKKVMVVGGGPAGMEVARVAALRGHNVMLFEKDAKLGGSITLAAFVKGFEWEDLLSLVQYLKTQMTKLGVKVHLGQEVSQSMIQKVMPDVLVIATGGKHHLPDLPGMSRSNVITSRDLHQKLKFFLRFLGPRFLRWATQFWMPIGKRVVIMGGSLHGCQVAEFLVKRGRKVTIVETSDKIGEGLLEILIKPRLLLWLSEKGVALMTEVKYEEITEQGLTIKTKEGKREILEADTIVTALPLLPNTDFLKGIEGSVSEVYTIGDCKEPRMIVDSVAEGSRIARTI